MNSVSFSLSKKRLFFPWLALSILGVVGIEHITTLIFGDLTLAPPLSIVCLCILAIFFSWRQVLFAGPIFALVTYYLILGTAYYPAVRAISVILAGVLAAWAARQKGLIESHAREVETILQTLPTPWIMSDHNGNITRLSNQAVSLFGIASKDAVGTSYFAFFNPVSGKGEFIRKYLDAFESSSPSQLALSLSKDPLQKVVANFFCLECDEGRRLLTVFSPLLAESGS